MLACLHDQCLGVVLGLAGDFCELVDRQVGKSKMSSKVAREALMLVPKLRFRVKRGRG